MTENGIQCEPALATAADIPQLLAAALSPLHLPYLLRCRVLFPLLLLHAYNTLRAEQSAFIAG